MMAKEPAPTPTKTASTLTVKFTEVAEGTKDSFSVAGKTYVKETCAKGELVDVLKAPAGQPGFWIGQDWEVGPNGEHLPSAAKSIVFADGDGYVKPTEDSK